MRPIEVMALTLKDIDLQNGKVYPSTAKHGSGRLLKITKSTLNLLPAYLSKRNIGLNEKIFGNWNSDIYGKWFRHYRNKIARKLNDPTLKNHKTLRFKAFLRYYALSQN